VAKAIALEDDLMFLSRIREAARATGAEVVVARSREALLEACRAEPPGVVLADLDSPRLAAIGAIRALKAEPALAGIPVVGFFSHVHEALAREAQAAGCERVLARSAFVRELPRLLAEAGASEPA
jgi:CheY-like chemotaxis protein